MPCHILQGRISPPRILHYEFEPSNPRLQRPTITTHPPNSTAPTSAPLFRTATALAVALIVDDASILEPYNYKARVVGMWELILPECRPPSRAVTQLPLGAFLGTNRLRLSTLARQCLEIGIS